MQKIAKLIKQKERIKKISDMEMKAQIHSIENQSTVGNLQIRL